MPMQLLNVEDFDVEDQSLAGQRMVEVEHDRFVANFVDADGMFVSVRTGGHE